MIQPPWIPVSSTVFWPSSRAPSQKNTNSSKRVTANKYPKFVFNSSLVSMRTRTRSITRPTQRQWKHNGIQQMDPRPLWHSSRRNSSSHNMREHQYPISMLHIWESASSQWQDSLKKGSKIWYRQTPTKKSFTHFKTLWSDQKNHNNHIRSNGPRDEHTRRRVDKEYNNACNNMAQAQLTK